MCRSEWYDRTERKFHKSESEQREEDNATHILKVLAGQLYQGDEYIIKHLKEDYIQ